jgi:phenylalanyl-tRNA synthetase alpha chain
MTRNEWEKKYLHIKKTYPQASKKAGSLRELENLKIKCLGRKGELTELLKSLKDFPLEDKKVLGIKGNCLKKELLDLLKQCRQYLEITEFNKHLEKEKTDITAAGYPFDYGCLHPLTIATDEMVSIFESLGFNCAEGNLIEDEKTNFDDLNTPPHHPARALGDTFYLNTPANYLLRTHTSNVQIRYMRKNKPPIRIISPGKVFRRDAIDASHLPVFNQIEGLYVDKNVSMADLKWTLATFMKRLFGSGAKIRFRPSYFPFVEPGAEVDVKCLFCQSEKSCSICKKLGWIEMLGAGMVHPNVFKAVDIDPEKYSGYAWGIGVERLAMLMYGISDIRVFYENDVRVLKHFQK